MSKRKTIGDNPLEAWLGNKIEKPSPAEKEEVHSASQELSTRRERITIKIPHDIIERIKNAVYWTPGLTLTSLAEEALLAAVDELERKKGAPFPTRKQELKPGRPLSS